MRAFAALIASLALVWPLLGAAQTRQPIPRNILDDQVLGWIKVYDYPPTTQTITMDGRVYTPAQLSTARLFTNWMQASYLPKGALGDVFQARNAELGPYNEETAAQPHAYGAIAKLYTQLMYGPNKKIQPLTSDAFLWGMEANGFYGSPVDVISTPQRYYFTLPSFVEQGYGPELDKASAVSAHPVLRQFPTRFVRNTKTGNQRQVILTKDLRDPVVPVTKGEYLQGMEAAVLRLYDTEKQKIARENVRNQRSIDYFMGYLNTNHEKRLAVLKSNKEKYQSRLQEPAHISTLQPNALLEYSPDVFEGNGGGSLRLPVYTYDPRVIELCKTDAPQWIVIYWTAHLNDPVSLSLHEAMLNNFNFQYVYDYFFDPDKVKGQPYKPLRSPSFTEAAVAGTPSETATKNAADPAVFFFEDFSASPVGKKPLNWRSTLNNAGASSVVTEVKGLEGRWASMAGMQISPTAMKAPVPSDFEVSYDVVAVQGYRWGAKGLTFKLSKTSGQFLSVKVRPGYDGREGEVSVEGQFPGTEGYLTRTMYAKPPGFSNNLANNRITVTLKKKGELLQVFIGQTKVAEYEKGVPAGLQFDSLSFDLGGNTSSPDEQMFVGKIRIAAQ